MTPKAPGDGALAGRDGVGVKPDNMQEKYQFLLISPPQL